MQPIVLWQLCSSVNIKAFQKKLTSKRLEPKVQDNPLNSHVINFLSNHGVDHIAKHRCLGTDSGNEILIKA